MKCCDLTAGKLRTPITIERQTETQGPLGATVAWATLYSLRAFVNPVSGAERYRADRLEATTQVRVFIRYVSDLDTSDRLIYKGKTLQIRAIINIEERDRWLELYCEGGVVT